LLKNDGNLLPLDAAKLKRIAVIGPDASTHPMPTGGGSGGANCPYVVTPLEGIKNHTGMAVNVTYNDGANPSTAAALAKDADIAVVFGHASSSEGSDRGGFSLEGNEDAFIAAVLAAQPNTIVVIHAVGAVLMPWEKQAKAILHAFVPGQEMGNAIADVLFGDVNPAGKLPITLPASATAIPTNTQRQYPGINGQMYYDEKLEVGYRWYDAHNVMPLFPFGHGLSYTTFSYTNLIVQGSIAAGLKVTVTITNNGKVAGSEVAQLYLVFPSPAGEPPQILAGIQKITLKPGDIGTVNFVLNARSVSIWSVSSASWTQVKGDFGILIGSSSRDIRIKGAFTN